MLNNVTLMGRLTAAPELKKTSSGVSVTAFVIAVDRPYKSGGEKETDFITAVAWRGTAEFICNYFGKGQMIALTGSIRTRRYEDKDGNKRTAFEVVADSVSFCGKRSADTTADKSFDAVRNKLDDVGFTEFTDDGDLPF